MLLGSLDLRLALALSPTIAVLLALLLIIAIPNFASFRKSLLICHLLPEPLMLIACLLTCHPETAAQTCQLERPHRRLVQHINLDFEITQVNNNIIIPKLE